MTIVWEDAWQTLNEAFARLATGVVIECPGLTWSCGHGENESFPFRAYAGFSCRGIQEEDVVVSVDFLLGEGEMHFSVDVALGDGQILAEGPVGIIPKSVDTVRLRSEIQMAISSAVEFILDSKLTIVEGLRDSHLS